MTNLNRHFAKLCGIPWHSHVSQKMMDDLNYSTCSCGNSFPSVASLYSHIKRKNPNFISDPRLVLREMDKHPKGKLFYAKLIYMGDDVEAIDDDGLISRHYLTDQTGMLVKAAIEFLEKEEVK